MEILNEIIIAEALYRQKLEDFFIRIFPYGTLPSHNRDHHQRVWRYCKEILRNQEIFLTLDDKDLPGRLIIAAYLHDSGMAVDSGPHHGLPGRMFCEQFLRENALSPEVFRETLDAVEYHDRKDYARGRKDSTILTVLSVADDLDALGYTGIYRYIEIYTARKAEMHELGRLIGSNVEGRFNYFLEQFGSVPSLTCRHKERYRIITQFCSDYSENAERYAFGTGRPSGICGIAEIIGSGIEDSGDTDRLFRYAEKFMDDKDISNFFTKLRKELLEN